MNFLSTSKDVFVLALYSLCEFFGFVFCLLLRACFNCFLYWYVLVLFVFRQNLRGNIDISTYSFNVLLERDTCKWFGVVPLLGQDKNSPMYQLIRAISLVL